MPPVTPKEENNVRRALCAEASHGRQARGLAEKQPSSYVAAMDWDTWLTVALMDAFEIVASKLEKML